MALVSDPGSLQRDQRWVKEGGQCGSFIIHEIRRGSVVYRRGDQLSVTTLDSGAGLPSIVRDPRPGARQVSAAVGDVIHNMSFSPDPNNIEADNH